MHESKHLENPIRHSVRAPVQGAGAFDQRVGEEPAQVDGLGADPLAEVARAWMSQIITSEMTSEMVVTLPVLTDAARLLTHTAERITVEPRAPVIALHADHQAACLPDLVLLASMLCSTGLHVVVTGARSGGAHPVAGDVFTAMGVPTAGCAAQIDAAFSRSDPACVPLNAISPRLDTWLQLPTTDPLHRLARALAPWADPIGVPADLRVLMTTDPAWAHCALQVAQARGVNALMLLAQSASATTGSAPRMRATLAAQGRITRLNPDPPWSDAERSALNAFADAAAIARWVQSVLAGEFPVPRQTDQLVELVLRVCASLRNGRD